MTEFNDENPQVPASPEAEVVAFSEIRDRLKQADAQPRRTFASPSNDDSVEDLPVKQNFEVALLSQEPGKPGTVLQANGYIVATSVFVGFADEQGIINALVPMNQVLYVLPKD